MHCNKSFICTTRSSQCTVTLVFNPLCSPFGAAVLMGGVGHFLTRGAVLVERCIRILCLNAPSTDVITRG